jgi:hypothetical protein
LANRKRKLSFMVPDIVPVITTARDTMPRDITGDPTDIGTTSVPIGGTGTGGITAGIGIEKPVGTVISNGD